MSTPTGEPPETGAQTLRGLVIDWGGVLTPPLDSTTGAWMARERVDRSHFRDVMISWVGPPAATAAPDGVVAAVEQAADPPDHSSPVHRLERGEMAVADFDQALARELGRRGSPVEAAGLTRRMLAELDAVDDAMVALVRRARDAGLRTALLSNSWGNPYPEVLTDGLFDAVVISGQVGMRKPEPRIYRHTADLLGLSTRACVMVDDLPHNVLGAADAGMVGILHRSYDETRAELEVLFDTPLG